MTTPASASPRLSIVVVVYNMRREAPRTLHSLSAAYQQGVSADDYEVIVVENGSTEPLDPATVAAIGPNFRYTYIANAAPSPVGAVNHGASLSIAPNISVMIDGARMATPGIVARTLEALDAFHPAAVTTIALHLGPDVQFRTMTRGYDRVVEDGLLASIDWPKDGYRLFEIGALAPSSGGGWLEPLAESNLISMPREVWDRLGGMDPGFVIRGGGLANLDFYNRVCELTDLRIVCLFGEATFHQFHGGIMTNRPEEQMPDEMRDYLAEYRTVRGKEFRRATRPHLVYGEPRPEALQILKAAADKILSET
ncbi:glycosyltransferase family 2 protein [Mesorhizobium australicum]|uniref:Glycosyltransferase, GT2 family n=1 Tax=Mesorhizobium australicum TaxID=536018 RepID=A0A1X7PAD4_9HYPH|nr:glycosyltransferase family A protein [Mesorhizobium australicum]SMH47449.1 Glycosyltransferase, GT2 family [Mesorhizobium australicum]